VAERAKAAATGVPADHTLPGTRGDRVAGTIFALVFVAICLAFVFNIDNIFGYFGPDYRLIPPDNAELAAAVPAFANMAGVHENLSGEPLGGKAVIVDKTKGTIHPLQRGLPNRLAADVPDEADIIVWVETQYIHDFDLIETEVVSPALQREPQSLEPAVIIPAYHARWNVTIINRANCEIRYRQTFEGKEPPSEKVTFNMPYWGDQVLLGRDNVKIRGAKVLLGEEGGILLASGKRVVGVVGPVPWDETLKWIVDKCGE
jgi:hypothetical protein